MGLNNGKVLALLEGGYFLPSLQESAALTLKTLLGDPVLVLLENLGKKKIIVLLYQLLLSYYTHIFVLPFFHEIIISYLGDPNDTAIETINNVRYINECILLNIQTIKKKILYDILEQYYLNTGTASQSIKTLSPLSKLGKAQKYLILHPMISCAQHLQGIKQFLWFTN